MNKNKSYWEILVPPITVVGGIATVLFLIFDKGLATVIFAIIATIAGLLWLYLFIRGMRVEFINTLPSAVRQLNESDTKLYQQTLEQLINSSTSDITFKDIHLVIQKLKQIAEQIQYKDIYIRCHFELEGYGSVSVPEYRMVNAVACSQPCSPKYLQLSWESFKALMIPQFSAKPVQRQFHGDILSITRIYREIAQDNGNVERVILLGNDRPHSDDCFYISDHTYHHILTGVQSWVTESAKSIIGDLQVHERLYRFSHVPR